MPEAAQSNFLLERHIESQNSIDLNIFGEDQPFPAYLQPPVKEMVMSPSQEHVNTSAMGRPVVVFRPVTRVRQTE